MRRVCVCVCLCVCLCTQDALQRLFFQGIMPRTLMAIAHGALDAWHADVSAAASTGARVGLSAKHILDGIQTQMAETFVSDSPRTCDNIRSHAHKKIRFSSVFASWLACDVQDICLGLATPRTRPYVCSMRAFANQPVLLCVHVCVCVCVCVHRCLSSGTYHSYSSY